MSPARSAKPDVVPPLTNGDRRPYAITLDVGSSLANRTGEWRTERPQYVHRLPPCNHACPAGEDIQGWLYEAEAGGAGYESAWRKLVVDNPIPAVMGRVCYHPCETACNRGQVDDAVGINAVERFLGDEAIRAGWELPKPAPASGKRVLVVGSGPSGLSVAYQLALRGHHVTIREQAAKPGGMMRYGIPTYRLPRTVLDAEIARILALGVELECNQRITDVKSAMREGGFDAAFLAVGAHVAKHTEIPGGTASHILDAVALLHGIEDGEKPQLGRRVVIYGGGDTALDAARSALRLGVAEPIIVYRRNREKMPADPSELIEAEEEGITFHWLSTIASAEEGQLKIERMELDDTGYPQPTGEFEDLAADAVVLALGQDADLQLLEGLDGIEVANHTVKVDDHMMTGHPGVFAGGDMVPDDRTVAVAIGHGRRAARCIDAWLRDEAAALDAERELASIENINTWYYEDAPRTVRPQLEDIRRQTTFEEVVKGLDESSALFEARRCLSCGNCFSCDNCFGVCPDNAVIKTGDEGEPYVFDLDYCKGCGTCATECPCGAIEMIPEAT
ncbi:MAG: NAD(P)-binding protein [Solirubrobacteraceae bacterium]